MFLIDSLSKVTIPSFKNAVLPALTAQQRKIATIVLAIVSAIGTCYLLVRLFFATREVKKISTSFLSDEGAKQILSKRDPFLNALTPFDIESRLKKPASEQEFMDFYLDQIQSISSLEFRKLSLAFNQIRTKAKEFGIKFPPSIAFIRTTGKEEIEGTAAYCRNENTIVFNWMSTKLLSHELFHLYSRNNPVMRKKLYALVGYQICEPLSLPSSLRDKRLTNPDIPYLDAYITVTRQGEKVHALPIDFYDVNYQGPGQNPFIKGLYHQFAILEEVAEGKMEFKLDINDQPILFDFDEAEDLYQQIGINTPYIDHPEEILADNFAMMILDLPTQSPDLIEKMKNCFLTS